MDQIGAPDVAKVLQDILFKIEEMNDLLRKQRPHSEPDNTSEDLNYNLAPRPSDLLSSEADYNDLYQQFVRWGYPFVWFRIRIVRNCKLIGYEFYGATLWLRPPPSFKFPWFRGRKSGEFTVNVSEKADRNRVLGCEADTVPSLERWLAKRPLEIFADDWKLFMTQFTQNKKGMVIAYGGEYHGVVPSDRIEPDYQLPSGYLWIMNLKGGLVDNEALRRILLVLCTNKNIQHSFILHHFLGSFIFRFENIYPDLRSNPHGLNHEYHFRLYEVERSDDVSFSPGYGLRPHRQRGEFPQISKNTKKIFLEKRLSILCIARLLDTTDGTPEGLPDLLLFKIVVLNESLFRRLSSEEVDDIALLARLRMDGSSRRPKGLSKQDPQRESPLEVAGISAAFQLVHVISYQFLEIWKRSWITCIDTLDESIQVRVEDISDEARMNELMFDASFERSKLYFKLLETLRIFSESIKEMRESIADLAPSNPSPGGYRRYLVKLMDNEATRPHAEHELRALENNWKIITQFHEEAEKLLLQRIATKAEGIKTLRDGLFNATALREATKGMALNRAIYVFTVVTVLYTPVGFLATFWALPFLNNPSDGDIIQEPVAFRNSFIILPVLTYFLSIFIAWYFGSQNARRIDQAQNARRIDQVIRENVTFYYEILADWENVERFYEKMVALGRGIIRRCKLDTVAWKNPKVYSERLAARGRDVIRRFKARYSPNSAADAYELGGISQN
ncbi:hypothetical protein F5Y10DRAFT_230236 [Nemania abortiva]|nr:hypothetical protein F5Y10DRAFT_230236 [Nemania abortiva]